VVDILQLDDPQSAPLRLGELELQLALVPLGAAILSMRSICLSLLCACVALVFLARKRLTNSIRRAISRSWCL